MLYFHCSPKCNHVYEGCCFKSFIYTTLGVAWCYRPQTCVLCTWVQIVNEYTHNLNKSVFFFAEMSNRWFLFVIPIKGVGAGEM